MRRNVEREAVALVPSSLLSVPLVDLWLRAMLPFLLLALPSGIAYSLILVFSRRCRVVGCLVAGFAACGLIAFVALFIMPALARTSPPHEGSIGLAYGVAASIVLGLYALLRLGLRLTERLRFTHRAFNPGVERASGD